MNGDLLFKKANVVTETGIVKSDLLIKNGKVASFEGKSAKEVDAEGLYITPGFIDIHIHGRYGFSSEEDIPSLAAELVKDGVTAFCPTTMTGPLDKTLETLGKMAAKIKEYPHGAEALGIYSEGMFFSRKKCGAQDPEYLISPSDKVIERMIEAAKGKLSVVALAPETENAVSATRILTENGIRTSIAHTAGSFEDAKMLINAYATGATHTYNAMTGFDHRQAGIVGAVLTDDRVYCELICDGYHVCETAVKMLHRCKPRDKVILISDNLVAAGQNILKSVSGGLPVVNLSDRFVLESDMNTLAGSAMPLWEMFRNYIKFTNDILGAVKAVSLNPARYIGRDKDIGSVMPGKRADLNIFDSNFNLIATYVKGEKI